MENQERFAQLHTLRGGYRPRRRDGNEREQTRRQTLLEPASVDIERERRATRRQDSIVSVVLTILILWAFAWALWGGLEASANMEAQQVRRAMEGR